MTVPINLLGQTRVDAITGPSSGLAPGHYFLVLVRFDTASGQMTGRSQELTFDTDGTQSIKVTLPSNAARLDSTATWRVYFGTELRQESTYDLWVGPIVSFDGIYLGFGNPFITGNIADVVPDIAPNYYLSLITSQYKPKPKFMSWVRAPLDLLSGVMDVLSLFDQAFDPDTAIGVQLDTVGQLVGASRMLPFQPSGGASPILDDDTYRLLIRARIAQNQWNGQLTSLYGIWKTLFPGGVIAPLDNQNMTVTIFLAGAFSSIVQDMIVNGLIVPRPEGVLYNFSFGPLPAFGFDGDHVYIAGFDEGHFA